MIADLWVDERGDLPSGPYNPQRLALTPGTRLGVYEITALLGAGGMGEVYRARDTKLGRDVAIKVLSDRFTHAERIARFQREAQILASLNHPHIAAIYGLEEANGSQFLILELVDGDTLADLEFACSVIKGNDRELTFADGRRLFVGSSGTGAPNDGKEPSRKSDAPAGQR